MKYLCEVKTETTSWSFQTDSYLCAAEHPNMWRVYKFREDANDGAGGYYVIITRDPQKEETCLTW